MGELQNFGFTNHEDFTASKSAIEEKIQHYHGIVIRSRFKIDKTFHKTMFESVKLLKTLKPFETSKRFQCFKT